MRRLLSTDQLSNNSSADPQSPNQIQDGIFRVPSNRSVTGVAVKPPSKGAANAIPQKENKFRDMSESELEISTQTKIFEADCFKSHFKELEKKCSVMQTSLDEMKSFYEAT